MSLSLSLGSQVQEVLVLVLVLGGQVLALVLVLGGHVLVLVPVLEGQVLVNIPGLFRVMVNCCRPVVHGSSCEQHWVLRSMHPRPDDGRVWSILAGLESPTVRFETRRLTCEISPRQQKINEMNGAHLVSPIRGELGYAHWPQLGTQFIALLGTKFGPH